MTLLNEHKIAAILKHCLKKQAFVIDDHQRQCAETRVLPSGGGGNLIVGRQSYEQEMEYRRGRIREGVHYELPTWDSLEVYQVAE